MHALLSRINVVLVICRLNLYESKKSPNTFSISLTLLMLDPSSRLFHISLTFLIFSIKMILSLLAGKVQPLNRLATFGSIGIRNFLL